MIRDSTVESFLRNPTIFQVCLRCEKNRLRAPLFPFPNGILHDLCLFCKRKRTEPTKTIAARTGVLQFVPQTLAPHTTHVARILCDRHPWVRRTVLGSSRAPSYQRDTTSCKNTSGSVVSCSSSFASHFPPWSLTSQ